MFLCTIVLLMLYMYLCLRVLIQFKLRLMVPHAGIFLCNKKETIDCWFIALLIIRRNRESCFTNCEIAFFPSISYLPRISNHITNVYTLNKSYIKPKWQWTVHRHLQHWVHKTKKLKKTKIKNTTQQAKKMSKTDPIKNMG